ncbi:MAG: potassium channel family protein [Chloroherpetonaceae bacterium]
MPNQSQSDFGLLDLVITVLSIYVLGALALDTFTTLNEEVSKLINYFDYLICAVFFFEFWYRLFTAENKWQYLKWGWIDLLSSIPMIDAFRTARLVRIVRVIRIVKAYRSVQQLLTYLFHNRVKGTFASAILTAVLMLIFSAIAILKVETAPESNITTAEDAIWWAFVTITTVGYGDKYPVTTEGRIVAAILMTVGVGLFGTFTAYISSWFVAGNQLQSQANADEASRTTNAPSDHVSDH